MYTSPNVGTPSSIGEGLSSTYGFFECVKRDWRRTLPALATGIDTCIPFKALGEGRTLSFHLCMRHRVATVKASMEGRKLERGVQLATLKDLKERAILSVNSFTSAFAAPCLHRTNFSCPLELSMFMHWNNFFRITNRDCFANSL